MSPPRNRGLWLHIAIPILAFVVLGSVVIATWLHADAHRESRNLFATLARTSADLVKTGRLPTDRRVAEELGQAFGMQVFFRRGAWDVTTRKSGELRVTQSTELIPPPLGELASLRTRLEHLAPGEGIVRLGPQWEAIAVALEGDEMLILARPLQPATTLLLRPGTLVVLSLFWLLSLALACVISSGVVRPMRQLEKHQPEIDSDSRTLPPGTDRNDELG